MRPTYSRSREHQLYNILRCAKDLTPDTTWCGAGGAGSAAAAGTGGPGSGAAISTQTAILLRGGLLLLLLEPGARRRAEAAARRRRAPRLLRGGCGRAGPAVGRSTSRARAAH